MIYVGCVIVIPVPLVTLLSNYGYGTSKGFWYDVGSFTTDIGLFGGIVFVIYYVISKAYRKKEPSTK